LAGDDARDTWGQLEVVMRRWRQIELLIGVEGPFIYRAGYATWRRLSLDDPANATLGARVGTSARAARARRMDPGQPTLPNG
jgi:hypothetical protein